MFKIGDKVKVVNIKYGSNESFVEGEAIIKSIIAENRYKVEFVDEVGTTYERFITQEDQNNEKRN